MQITRLSPNDQDDFLRFISSIQQDFLRFKNLGKSHMRRYLEDPGYQLLVSKEDETIAGYIAYRIEAKDKMQFIGVGVGQSHRGTGLASRLFERMLSETRKIRPLTIYGRTWETNQASRRLMEKYGLRKYRTIPCDRINGESSVWFRRLFR
ncbi:GNAT family N-acetyltransferase [Candidatus Woesearchaeota archaeon]|nr:GNAT family N-acetyltransferase [Candidatus Woesearchaeota archaeon]